MGLRLWEGDATNGSQCRWSFFRNFIPSIFWIPLKVLGQIQCSEEERQQNFLTAGTIFGPLPFLNGGNIGLLLLTIIHLHN
jgi:hypothetical protein